MKITHRVKKYGIELKIDDNICYQCGKSFDLGKHKKTEHHSIPRFLHPQMNVLVPIGKSCHDNMNGIFSPKLLYHKNQLKMLMNSFKKGNEKIIKKFNKLIINMDLENGK